MEICGGSIDSGSDKRVNTGKQGGEAAFTVCCDGSNNGLQVDMGHLSGKYWHVVI